MSNNNVGYGDGIRQALLKKASEPDVMKVFAVLGVMWQGILGITMKENLTVGQKAESIIMYDFVKYTAPFFIFAICFDICKIKNVPYKKQLWHKIIELLVPYFCWSTVYILMNIGSYKTIGSVLEGYFLGTNAPHTWYLVMMFQFHILVPILWYLYAKLTEKKKRAYPVFIVTFILYVIFILLYDKYVFNVATNKALIYLDRSFIGFSIYAVLGTIASANYEKWNKLIHKIRLIAIPFFLIAFTVANNEMFVNGTKKLSLVNSIYLKPSMLMYNIFAIILVYSFSRILIKNNYRSLPAFRFLSQYAYRAYLANFFVISMLVKFMGKSGKIMPYTLRIFLLWILTAACSFIIVYTIEFVVKVIKNAFMKKEVAA